MRRTGDKDTKPMECINPPKNRWAVRWDFQPTENDWVNYEEAVFDYRPGAEEIKSMIGAWINARTEETIMSGYSWKGATVWLSQENQLNYKTAYDLAVQTGGDSLPVTFKFGDSAEPKYYTFDDIDEFSEFFTGMVRHIQNALSVGWSEKDEIDFSQYERPVI